MPLIEDKEFILRVKRKGELEQFIGRRYGDFTRLHKQLRIELPGKVLPPVPKKNRSDTTATGLLGRMTASGNDSDASSISSISTLPTEGNALKESMKNLSVRDHRRNLSSSSRHSSPRPSMDGPRSPLPGSKPDVSLFVISIHIERSLTLVDRYALARKPEDIAESFLTLSPAESPGCADQGRSGVPYPRAHYTQ